MNQKTPEQTAAEWVDSLIWRPGAVADELQVRLAEILLENELLRGEREQAERDKGGTETTA